MYNSQQGRFYIYTLSGGQYVLDSGMPIDGTSGSHLGYAVNLNDDGTKVGIGTNGSQGWAKVYERSSSGSWSLRGSTFGSGAYWTRGLVLDASGDRALGAAHGDGTLKLFDWSGSAYTETTTFSGSGTIFGCGFDMTRDGLTVIGINRDTNAIVKVWKYASGSWSQLGSDINVGDMTDAIHMARGTGTRFVVGAHFNNSSTGIVKVYEYSGSSWSEIKQWTGYTSGVSLGIDHSISDDGTIIIAGSNTDDTGSSGSNAGMISIFTETNGIWEEKRFFGDTDNDQLGYGVTMSYDGGFYAACAPDNDEAASNAGKVRIYQNKNVLDFDGYNKLTFTGLESGSTSNVTFDGNTYSIGTASNVYIENTGTYEAESKGTTTFALTKNVVTGSVTPKPSSTVDAGNFTLAFRHGSGTTDTSTNNCTLYSSLTAGEYDWGTVNSVSSTSTETTYNVTFGPMTNIEYLVLAGGGGGSNDYPGGGGGGGGMLDGTETNIPGNTYDIVVGDGGGTNTSGTNSSFHTFTAIGGGVGSVNTGASGGSGGGGGRGNPGGTGVAGPPRHGYNGGTGDNSTYSSGASGGVQW